MCDKFNLWFDLIYLIRDYATSIFFLVENIKTKTSLSQNIQQSNNWSDRIAGNDSVGVSNSMQRTQENSLWSHPLYVWQGQENLYHTLRQVDDRQPWRHTPYCSVSIVLTSHTRTHTPVSSNDNQPCPL